MKYLAFILLFISSNLFCQNCPTGACTNYTISFNIEDLPGCESAGIQSAGDIDNNSDCNDTNVGNCFKWIFNKQAGSLATGISIEIGQGNGCNGEVDNIYTEINNTCIDLGSTGSQNEFTFQFNGSNTITIWVCDGSSGVVSLCNLCVEYPLLPVEITSFNLEQKGDGVQLEWKTEIEVDNFGFVVQRSVDAFNWEDIHLIKGVNSINGSTYKQIDTNVPYGKIYYRLKQIDFDGFISYSEIRGINIQNRNSLLSEAIENGLYYNYMGQLVSEKKGLVFIVYKGKSYKVFIQ
jgi:hypothetical protein